MKRDQILKVHLSSGQPLELLYLCGQIFSHPEQPENHKSQRAECVFIIVIILMNFTMKMIFTKVVKTSFTTAIII